MHRGTPLRSCYPGAKEKFSGAPNPSAFSFPMHPESLTEDWPSLPGQKELPDAGEGIIAGVEEFEESWSRDVLDLSLNCPANRTLVGPSIVAVYARKSTQLADHRCPYRRNWLMNALNSFRNSLAHPSVRFHSSGTNSAGHEEVTVQGKECLLRIDQIYSARLWKVGIETEDAQRSRQIAKYILIRCAQRLANDISCIDKLCRAQLAGKLPQAEHIQWSTESRGLLFERLIIDILNEGELRAKRASLFEDLFEWTDIRVNYPDLDRKRGARIQVKFIGDEHVEDEQTAARRHTESHVILSPVRLARYVEAACENGTEAIGPQFWNCLQADPADTSELAMALSKIFNSALENALLNPLGPMAYVPPIIRQLVRSFVRKEAFEANERMLHAREGCENLPPRWRSRL